MDREAEERAQQLQQLGCLLTVAQDLARKLADRSHGRAYDKVRDFNQLLHLARLQLTAIEADGGQWAAERRKTPRAAFEPGAGEPV